MFTIKRKDGIGETLTVDAENILSTCELLSENGRYPLDVIPVAAANSTFEKTVTDDAAKARIEKQHAALAAGGITVNASEQLYATGTRMADVGYDTQAARKREHEAKLPFKAACDALRDIVLAEKRKNVIVTAKEFAEGIHANGSITVNGYRLRMHAIRGLSGRIDSPMAGYLQGLADRMSSRAKTHPANDADRAIVADVIRHECLANPNAKLMLRMRENSSSGPDIFAVLGETYSCADAPEATRQLINAGLPDDARASFSYDPASTAWELRASTWTPTPVAEQAVGEAFEGYVSFQSKDNGTGRFRGGGGITLLRCLNASTYTADDVAVSRVHRGRVLWSVREMLQGATRAIDTLCEAWGTARKVELDFPEKLTLEQAIPGFYMYMLRGRGSELAGVLTGRTSEHAAGLSKAYFDERRDANKVVKADLAQGWTRYIQSQSTEVRRDGERAIGDWLMDRKPVKCDML